MVKRFYILSIFLSFSLGIHSQVNLVPNPSFDNCTQCPTITGQYHYCNNWLNCNGNIGVGLWGTPDYYNTCGTFHPTYNPIPPNTAQGFCNTNTGSGMMGIVCYNTPYPNYREYLSAQLNCPLQPGSTYTVSFWINAGTSPKVKYNTSHVGVYLSTTMPVQSGYLPILVTPDYEITTIISNTTWVQHTFTINPTATLNWITLGCFRNDVAIGVNLATPAAPYPYSNYFLDDIAVMSSSGSLGSTISSQNVSCNSSSNGSATITPTSPGSYSYLWSPGNQNTQSITNLPVGIYTVTISNACGSDTKTISITQQPGPSVTISNSNATVCPNSNLVLQANALGGTPSYSYSWGSSTVTSSSLSVNPQVNSIYSCTVTDSQGCQGTSIANISVSSVTANFMSQVDQCSSAFSATNTSVGSTNSFWDFGDGTSSFAASPTHTFSGAGTYSVTLIAANSQGCSDTIQQVITINSVIQSAFSFTSTLCSSTVLLENNSQGVASYLWNFGDGNTSTATNPSSYSYNNSGNYTISLTLNPGSPCASTSSQTVLIVNGSLSSFNLTSSICSKAIGISNSSSLANSFLWNFGDGSSSNSVTPTHTYLSPGIYTVSLITNPGTTCSDTSFQTVIIYDNPLASFTYSLDICSGSVTFSNTSLNANNYSWNFGNGVTSSEPNPVITFLNGSANQVTLVAQPGQSCANSTVKTVIVNYIPVKADFTYINPQYSYVAEFTNLSSNATSYIWSFGDGEMSGVFEPSHAYAYVGSYTVCLEASNTYGCHDLICKQIKIDADWTLYVPNTFTPNEDGKNDIFNAYGSNLNSFKIMIFDRWGEQLFYSDDLLKGWDGTYKGKPVQEGVYVWKISATDMYNKAHDLNGHINVIR